MKRLRLLRAVLVASMVACIASPLALHPGSAWAAPAPYNTREDVRKFIGEMVDKHGFERKELEQLFSRVRYQASVIQAMTPPPTAPQRSWQSYRSMFLNPLRIDGGVEFWKRNATTLSRASAEFGVPEEVIVAIIGVETVYGRNTGTYRVIDALTTLAFDWPPRQDFFRSELESYLLYARETDSDVFLAKGSYAGAMGIPQFMPSNYRRLAVDYDGDGKVNLAGSPADAIASVANYLRAHGWERGEPSAVPAEVSGEAWRPLVDAGIKPHFNASDLAQFGVTPAESLPSHKPVAVVELQTPGGPSAFWVGMQNFYAVTRYNRSSFYAIAVLELSRALKQAREQKAAASAQQEANTQEK